MEAFLADQGQRKQGKPPVQVKYVGKVSRQGQDSCKSKEKQLPEMDLSPRPIRGSGEGAPPVLSGANQVKKELTRRPV